MEVEAIARRIREKSKLRGSFTLRSGRVSDTYFDKYLFESDPRLLSSIAQLMAPLIPGDTEILCGLEMGGIPVVTMLSQVTGLPAAFVRKTPKTHGTCKYAEGPSLIGRRIALIEDVVSSGGAILDAVAMLRHVSVVLQRQHRILLVQEKKPENHGRWNLPGGHLELGETIQSGALREVREETGLQVRLSELVGVYTSIRPPDYHAIRFVFTAEHDGKEPMAGDDILAVQWRSLSEMEALPDSALVGGERLRRILSDAEGGVRVPLSLLRDFRQA